MTPQISAPETPENDSRARVKNDSRSDCSITGASIRVNDKGINASVSRTAASENGMNEDGSPTLISNCPPAADR